MHSNSSSSTKASCAITGRDLPRKQLVNLETIRPTLADLIHRDHPGLPHDALVSRSEIARYRTRYVEELLSAETGDISEIERRVAESLATNETLAENVEEEFEEKRSFGEVVSDHLASFGGSWMFILSFLVMLGVWIAFNLARGTDTFDPYPFILLNLILSCIAALQAPVIMMSQKRQEAKDRLRSQHDYQINLKAELEIRHLHEKLDHLLSHQWERLVQIQEVQLQLLSDLDARRK